MSLFYLSQHLISISFARALFVVDTRDVVDRLRKAEEKKRRMEAAAAKKAADIAAGGTGKTASGIGTGADLGPRPEPIALPTVNIGSSPSGSGTPGNNAKAKRRGSAFV